MNALIAYTHGGTGAGIRVGVIDSGIDLQSAEFGDCSGGIGTGSCRILAASRDTAGNGTLDDEGGHGTAVAFTIAGRRNDAGTHGVAFDAQLIVARADSPGSCATETPSDPDSGCSFGDNAIAAGLDAARTGGARVVNISLGGDAPNARLLQAIGNATAAGIVIVISAGNDGEEPEGVNPDPFAGGAAASAGARGLVIIAGSVNTADTISDFSNRAGTGASTYLAAVGERVRAPDQTNTPLLWSGTSFSAPQIAGAVALLAQAFPNLSGAQIVQLLYATARDVGAAGVDPVYGRGVLDLTRAFQPVGTTSLAGSTGVVSSGVNGALSAPMGDASQGPLGAVVLDSFDRAFATELARTIVRQGPARRLPALMATRQRSFSAGVRDLSVAVSLIPARDTIRIERLGIGTRDANVARMLAATVSGRLGSKAQFAIGASESGNTLTARLAGRDEPAFLVARDPLHSAGFDVDVRGSVAVRQSLGRWGVTLAQEQGQVLSRRDTQFAALRWDAQRSGYWRTTLGIDRRFGGLRAGLSFTRLSERDTVLGARFSGGLGAARADSNFVDLGLRYDLGEGWSLGGAMRQGWTHATLRSGVEGGGVIRTNGFAADIGKDGIFAPADSFGFRIAQPLRVASGGIGIALPADWDYATMAVSAWDRGFINLTPQGRELDYELRYAWPLAGGMLSSNLFLRRNPGNFASFPSDKGGAVRLTLGW
ncbi:peptidase S8 [Sphingomonas naasensis]|uniref:Peptidase S8 n=2 Tax=Sphingomonas naasensis TaxID=1344951 RepID=A0A4S1WN39_9SPHN|nr:peptidase S8 [Sphingomonas naasensis]